MRRVSVPIVLVALFLSGCSGSPAVPSNTPLPLPSATAASTAAATSTVPVIEEPIAGSFDVNGHELFLSCTAGSSPTIVIEAGEGQTSNEMEVITPELAERGRVCSYDRANHGQSGEAPTPRTGEDISNDLHALLEAASVPGPYVLIGHSAGGMFVQLYARLFPDEVAGVMVTNAVPLCEPWMELGFPQMTEAERDDETGYLNGQNDEPVLYCDVSERIAALPAPAIPLEVLISTVAQCASVHDICGRTYPAYTQVMREISDSWPMGHFAQVDSIHSIYVGEPEAFLAAVDRLMARIPD
jgi:pimeloyl-ACP methyl ester carboxylesterase